MKRLNYLALGSITVVASLAVANLLISPVLWEGEQNYICVESDNQYICTVVEYGTSSYTHTCYPDYEVEGRSNCYGGDENQYLNNCYWENDLICYLGYKKEDNLDWDWGYYFTEDFWWEFECNYTHTHFASLDVNDLINVNYLWDYQCESYGESPEYYGSCEKRGDDMFCLANYSCSFDNWWYSCYEDNNSGEYNCALKDFGLEEQSLTSLNMDEEYVCEYHGDGEYNDLETCYENGEWFFCPIEYECEEWYWGEYCWDEQWWDYYCMPDNYFDDDLIVEAGWENEFSCFTKNGDDLYENCEYDEYNEEYFCPINYECTLDDDWYYCGPQESWNYSCRMNLDSSWVEPQAFGELSSMMTFTCENGEISIANCEKYYLDDIQSVTSTVLASDYYLFCPVETKYNCNSEEGLEIVCEPSTIGAFSCNLPSLPSLPTVNNIHDGIAVCSDDIMRYDNCYLEWWNYICPIPHSCELWAWWYYCSNDRGAEDYYYCNFYDLVLDSDFNNYSDSFCEEQKDNWITYGECYYEGYWYVFCPIKYECELSDGTYICEPYNWTAWDDYFYCASKYPSGVAKAAALWWDYYCQQPKTGWEKYNDCDYTNNNFYCSVTYDCTSVTWWHQCEIDSDGQYECELPTAWGLKSVAEARNYVCSDGNENSYSNCYPSENGYFCPEEESTTVKLDLYVWWCVVNNMPTVDAVENIIYCEDEWHLWSVTVNKNSWADANYLTNAVRENLPSLEEWMEWVWRLDNNPNAEKLSGNTIFTQNSSLYLFQDEKSIGTINFNSDWGTDIDPITWYYNSTIQLPTPTKTGYTFVGWYDGTNKVPLSYTIQWDVNLKAYWSENKPSNGYSWWGGSSSSSSKWTSPSVDDPKQTTQSETNNDAWKNIKIITNAPVNTEKETFNAHQWAYSKWLTKYRTPSEARMDDFLNRSEMAKISSIFATEFLDKTPDTKKKEFCSQYSDMWKVEDDMKFFIAESCELGYMWYESNGIDALERFRPYTPLTVAETATILSRIVWGNENAMNGKDWYKWHLYAAYNYGLIDDIKDPTTRSITRREAYTMLYRLINMIE